MSLVLTPVNPAAVSVLAPLKSNRRIVGVLDDGYAWGNEPLMGPVTSVADSVAVPAVLGRCAVKVKLLPEAKIWIPA